MKYDGKNLRLRTDELVVLNFALKQFISQMEAKQSYQSGEIADHARVQEALARHILSKVNGRFRADVSKNSDKGEHEYWKRLTDILRRVTQ